MGVMEQSQRVSVNVVITKSEMRVEMSWMVKQGQEAKAGPTVRQYWLSPEQELWRTWTKKEHLGKRHLGLMN